MTVAPHHRKSRVKLNAVSFRYFCIPFSRDACILEELIHPIRCSVSVLTGQIDSPSRRLWHQPSEPTDAIVMLSLFTHQAQTLSFGKSLLDERLLRRLSMDAFSL